MVWKEDGKYYRGKGQCPRKQVVRNEYCTYILDSSLSFHAGVIFCDKANAKKHALRLMHIFLTPPAKMVHAFVFHT